MEDPGSKMSSKVSSGLLWEVGSLFGVRLALCFFWRGRAVCPSQPIPWFRVDQIDLNVCKPFLKYDRFVQSACMSVKGLRLALNDCCKDGIDRESAARMHEPAANLHHVLFVSAIGPATLESWRLQKSTLLIDTSPRTQSLMFELCHSETAYST